MTSTTNNHPEWWEEKWNRALESGEPLTPVVASLLQEERKRVVGEILQIWRHTE